MTAIHLQHATAVAPRRPRPRFDALSDAAGIDVVATLRDWRRRMRERVSSPRSTTACCRISGSPAPTPNS